MQIDYDEDVVHCATREIYRLARSQDKRPFFLTVSLTHPHDPYVTTREYWDRYSDDDITDPDVGFIPLDRRDPHSHALYFHYGQHKVDISESQYRNARRGYYGMTSYVDDLFGQVLSALKNTGFDEYTAILFTSDHGDMLGERGMWFKKTLFEPAIRVPCMLSLPGVEHSKVDGPVTLVDILPTMLDIAGLTDDSLVASIDGISLLYMQTSTRQSRPVYVEHLDGGTIAPRVMVRKNEFKYVYSREYPPQLFNLVVDPGELVNLAGDAAHVAVEKELRKLVEDKWQLDSLAEDVADNQRNRRIVSQALSNGRIEDWNFQPRPQVHNTDYVRKGDAFPDVERRGYLPYK